eukprot:CAMPEP_0115734850 /NCGR_PEP_ID=MMETSP0272-20121206/86407_1 /TAXON_ID=71861 /ORGANISM="Scrippsiella trochoidea, Strain CCMP3099" /LENGTH=120 /DNA_ID=CAMNT_0003178919 /DNA_START=135 /DNA_END=498 /DNA_ORIENTATION=+
MSRAAKQRSCRLCRASLNLPQHRMLELIHQLCKVALQVRHHKRAPETLEVLFAEGDIAATLHPEPCNSNSPMPVIKALHASSSVRGPSAELDCTMLLMISGTRLRNLLAPRTLSSASMVV